MHELAGRLDRIERRQRDAQGGSVSFEFDGRAYEMAAGQWRRLLDEVEGSRHYPGGLAHESA